VTGEHDPNRQGASPEERAVAETVLAVAASAWAVLMAVAPVLQIRRMLRERSSRQVSVANSPPWSARPSSPSRSACAGNYPVAGTGRPVRS
jgi:hypothetical protein